jgi:O-antigen ligase
MFSIYEPSAKNLVGFVSSSSIETMHRISSDEAKNVIADEDTAQVTGIKNSRAKFWALSLRSFSKKPQGYGLGKAGHVANNNKKIFKDAKDASIYSTDGWYLKLINETGIWGGISYLILFIVIIVSSLKHFKEIKSVLSLYIFVIILIVAIQNIMSNVLDFYSFPIFYWMLIGYLQNFIEDRHA